MEPKRDTFPLDFCKNYSLPDVKYFSVVTLESWYHSRGSAVPWGLDIVSLVNYFLTTK